MENIISLITIEEIGLIVARLALFLFIVYITKKIIMFIF